MIIDNLQNLAQYTPLHPLFPKALEYVLSLDFTNLEKGKFEIDGENLFAMISDSDMTSAKDTPLEAHNQYIDIQIPISKKEQFGWASRSNLKIPISEFDKKEDIQFFNDNYSLLFDLPSLHFVIFFPQDAHAPCLGEGKIEKIVIKVKVNI